MLMILAKKDVMLMITCYEPSIKDLWVPLNLKAHQTGRGTDDFHECGND